MVRPRGSKVTFSKGRIVKVETPAQMLASNKISEDDLVYRKQTVMGKKLYVAELKEGHPDIENGRIPIGKKIISAAHKQMIDDMKKQAQTKKPEAKKTPYEVAKELGVKGIRKTTKAKKLKEKIETHLIGQRAVDQLKAGQKSDSSIYKGISEEATRRFAEFVSKNRFNIDNNIRTFDGRGVPTEGKSFAGLISPEPNSRFVYKLTEFGRDIAHEVLADVMKGSTRKKVTEMFKE